MRGDDGPREHLGPTPFHLIWRNPTVRIKLSKTAIAKLTAPDPSGRQRLHWDTELRGLGLLCSGVSPAKTFVVQHDIAGKTRRVTIAPANVIDVEEARARARAVLAEFYQGIDPKAGRRAGATLRQTLEAYIAARKTLRPKSIKDYTDHVDRYFTAWADLPMRELTADMVEARHRSLQAEIAAGGRYSGACTANTAMVTLRVLYGFAADCAAERGESLPPNPVARLKKQKQWFPVERRTRMVKAEDLPRFYRAVLGLQNPIARDLLLLMLFCGMRRTESSTLTWNDVDLTQRVIRVPAARTKSGRKLDLPMSDFVHDMLVARRAIGNAGGWVFPANGAAGHIAEPKHFFASIERTTGIAVSAHDLRRTFVTVAESCEISVMALKGLVNHSLGRDVTSGYVQMTAERLRAPMQKVTDKLKDLCAVAPVEGENVERLTQ
jgi:integrase